MYTDYEHRILEAASVLFKNYGIKNISILEIAKRCGISNKTVYEFFKDKDALVLAVLKGIWTDLFEDLSVYRNESRDAIEELVVTVHPLEVLSHTINPTMLYDLQKYHPEAWRTSQNYKQNEFTGLIKGNLERGINEGLFRADIAIDIIARLRQTLLDILFDPMYFPAGNYDKHKLLKEFTTHYIRGIVTPKGYKALDRHLVSANDTATHKDHR